MTETDRERVMRMYNDGMPIKYIADIVYYSTSEVYRVIHSIIGRSMIRRQEATIHKRDVYELWKSGMNYRQLADKYGVSNTWIRMLITEQSTEEERDFINRQHMERRRQKDV